MNHSLSHHHHSPVSSLLVAAYIAALVCATSLALAHPLNVYGKNVFKREILVGPKLYANQQMHQQQQLQQQEQQQLQQQQQQLHEKRIINDAFDIIKESIFNTNNHLGSKGVPKFNSEEEQASSSSNSAPTSTNTLANTSPQQHERRVLNDAFGIIRESIFNTNNHLGNKGVPKFGSEEEY